jgi:hypothetical protein
MTTPDEALLWARETAAPHHGHNRTMDRAEAYRAGQSANAERVAVLEAENARLRALLKEALPFIGYQMHVPELLAKVADAINEGQAS